MAIFAAGTKQIKLPKSLTYDPDDKRYYTLTYRPKLWEPNKEYIQGVDIVLNSVTDGLYHICDSGGKSGVGEPFFASVENQKTVDNTVSWVSAKYDFLLNRGDVISNSTWTGSNGETIDNASIVDDIQTKFRLLTVQTGASKSLMTNHITVTRINGDIEEFDRTMIIPVNQL